MSGGDVTTEADIAAEEVRARDISSRGRQKDRRMAIRRRWKRAIKMVIRSNRVKGWCGEVWCCEVWCWAIKMVIRSNRVKG